MRNLAPTALNNDGPSLGGGKPLTCDELAFFRLIPVSCISQPRMAFPAFGDLSRPDSDGCVKPWDGPSVIVLMVPGS